LSAPRIAVDIRQMLNVSAPPIYDAPTENFKDAFWE